MEQKGRRTKKAEEPVEAGGVFSKARCQEEIDKWTRLLDLCRWDLSVEVCEGKTVNDEGDVGLVRVDSDCSTTQMQIAGECGYVQAVICHEALHLAVDEMSVVIAHLVKAVSEEGPARKALKSVAQSAEHIVIERLQRCLHRVGAAEIGPMAEVVKDWDGDDPQEEAKDKAGS
jgi:hypothetical protein